MTDAPNEPTNAEPTNPESASADPTSTDSTTTESAVSDPAIPETVDAASAEAPEAPQRPAETPRIAADAQPTEPQPTLVAPTVAASSSAIPPVVPNPAPSSYSSVTPPPPAAPSAANATTESPKKRSVGVGMVVAAAAIAAIVGAGAGAGIGIGYANNSDNTAPVNSNPSSITVNDTKSATTITAVAEKASPSVVTINVTGTQEAGTGSGIILTSDGYVLTNNHVVTLDGESSTGKIQVETNDGSLLSAKVVGTDPIEDLAVIKLQNATGLQPAQFADSSKLNVGDSAIAIGAPLGLAGTVTNGIVSALNRSIQVASSAVPTTGSGDSDGSGSGSGSGNGQNGPFDFWNPGGGSSSQTTASSTISLPVIQTDAAINPGNSGGALLDSDGKVIGVNCAIASAGDSSSSDGSQTGSIGVGFAIPSNLALRIANELIKNGSATHGLLGASVEDVTSDTSQTNAKTVGASIHSVTAGGAAAAVGLKAGDIVTNFNGIPITSANDLTAQVRAVAAGSKATLTYVRGNHATKVTVTLGTLK